MTIDDRAPAGTGFDALPDDCVVVPAGSAQRGLWLTQELDPASPAYLITNAFVIDGDLDVPALAAALDELVVRHESLRTGFLSVGNEIHQVIHETVPSVLRVADVTTDEDVAAAVERENSTPFDLARPPLLRVLLLRRAARRHALVVALHHIVVEGVSIELLWADLAVLYSAAVDGTPAGLPELPLRYADFAAWQDEWMRTDDYREQLGFWRDHLTGAPPAISMPEAAADGPSWQGGSHSVWLSEAGTASVAAFARRHDATSFMALLMVFSGVLHRWSAQPDVIVGTPVTLRDQPGLENVVGLLINSVPLRLTWGDDPTAADALRRVRIATAEAMAHKQVPFDHLVTALPELREPGRDPIMQVMFAYQDELGAETGLRLADTSIRPIPVRVRTAKFDLSLDCVIERRRLRCAFEWSDDRLDQGLVRLFADHFLLSLRHVLEHGQARVGEWPLADQPSTPDWLASFLGEQPAAAGGDADE
ncbi:MAG TPA: condensation domain-containing protein [Pseudonocardiaceae bacterium]